mmetsp:Transcript_23914/g.60900  ORF Transcript_23914/g.60900 Transcript_23914/m.60900 type:complete len:527 (-) Transcript_23914:618-2198(-)
MASTGDVTEWKTPDVVRFLQRIGLQGVAGKFEDNEVTGEDLVSLTASELKMDVGITKLQAMKIKRALREGEGGPPSSLDVDPDAAGGTAAAAAATSSGAAYPSIHAEGAILHLNAEHPDAAVGLRAGTARRPGAGAAPAPSAPPHPALGVPIGAAPMQAPAAIDAALVQAYGQAIATITALEGDQVALKLPAAKERLRALTQNFAEEEKKVYALKTELEKNSTRYSALDGGKWYPGKYLLGKHRHQNKVEQAQAKASDTQRKLEAAAGCCEVTGTKLAAQQALVTELEGKVGQLAAAKRAEADLLVRAFTGAAGDAHENAIEGEVGRLAPQLEQVRTYKTTYARAYELIRQARKQLEQAQSLLESSSRLAGIDVASNIIRPRPAFTNTRGGVMVDVAKRAQARQATALCGAAVQAVVQAKTLIPDMPRVELTQIRALTGMGIMDIMFDNIVTDVIVAQKIRKALRQLESQLADVRYAERWLEGWISGRIDADLRQLEAAYAAKKAELDAYRKQLMMQAVQAAGGGR